GTSSGFATFATFIGIPYAILNVEHNFAPHAGIRLNDRHYPFAMSNQVLTWGVETTEELVSLFNELYADPRACSALPSEDMTGPAAQITDARSPATERP